MDSQIVTKVYAVYSRRYYDNPSLESLWSSEEDANKAVNKLDHYDADYAEVFVKELFINTPHLGGNDDGKDN